MTNAQGDFVWYELMTTDADAAQAFYEPLIGWTFTDSGTPDVDYRIGSMAARARRGSAISRLTISALRLPR